VTKRRLQFGTAVLAAVVTAGLLTQLGLGGSDKVQIGNGSVSALAHAGVKDDLTYVSTAGGAFLEWMEGKTLPGVAALMK